MGGIVVGHEGSFPVGRAGGRSGGARGSGLAPGQRPFLDGARAVDGRAPAAAAAIPLVTTICAARRWKTVAEGLDVRPTLVDAVAAYYRCLFLNLTLPGGIAGDVHRGVRHGRDVRNLGHASRAVAWERAAGQVVQVLLAISVLLVMPSPLRASMPFVSDICPEKPIKLTVAISATVAPWPGTSPFANCETPPPPSWPSWKPAKT